MDYLISRVLQYIETQSNRLLCHVKSNFIHINIKYSHLTCTVALDRTQMVYTLYSKFIILMLVIAPPPPTSPVPPWVPVSPLLLCAWPFSHYPVWPPQKLWGKCRRSRRTHQVSGQKHFLQSVSEPFRTLTEDGRGEGSYSDSCLTLYLKLQTNFTY